jgi:hypothetical protein
MISQALEQGFKASRLSDFVHLFMPTQPRWNFRHGCVGIRTKQSVAERLVPGDEIEENPSPPEQFPASRLGTEDGIRHE